jgi:hypothetical protein
MFSCRGKVKMLVILAMFAYKEFGLASKYAAIFLKPSAQDTFFLDTKSLIDHMSVLEVVGLRRPECEDGCQAQR